MSGWSLLWRSLRSRGNGTQRGAISYLGLVYEKPHESWHQHRARHAAFPPHLLLQEREGSGRRLLRHGHRVGLSHARHAGGGLKPTTGANYSDDCGGLLRAPALWLLSRFLLQEGKLDVSLRFWQAPSLLSFIHSYNLANLWLSLYVNDSYITLWEGKASEKH